MLTANNQQRYKKQRINKDYKRAMEDRNTDIKRPEAKTDKAEFKQKKASTSQSWWIIRQKDQNRSLTC